MQIEGRFYANEMGVFMQIKGPFLCIFRGVFYTNFNEGEDERGGASIFGSLKTEGEGL